MTRDTDIVSRLTSHAVELNGLIVPGRSIEATLARHAFNLFVSTGEDEYKMSLSGSATAIRYGPRKLLLATQHQLRGFDEMQVAMLTDGGSHLITSGGRRGYNPNDDTDGFDLIAFDFTEPCADRPELNKRFFDFQASPFQVPDGRVLAMLLVGYPSAMQVYEVHDKNHVGLVRRNVTCLPHAQPSDQATLLVKARQTLEFDPDGMSGGPAFAIIHESGGPKAYFAGVIVRGGRDMFTIIKADFVWAFLQSVFNE